MPACCGFPVKPPEMSISSPGGSAPENTLNTYGLVPPSAVNEVEYGAFHVPRGTVSGPMSREEEITASVMSCVPVLLAASQATIAK